MPSENTQIIMADLTKRGQKALEFAKVRMKNENMEYTELREALDHYLSNWHDYTHAGLFSLACEAVGGNPDDSVSIQASLAMIAAAFDLHDDILDQSETKHAQPTVYGKFGEELTLLLGNAFLIQGFMFITKTIAENSPSKMQETLLTLKTNLFEVGNAHALELGLKGKKVAEPKKYMDFIKKKAASIEADMCLGAIFGGGTETEIKALSQYGIILGILATLREEFIDIYETEELFQKINIERLPIPLVFAMQNEKTKMEINEIILKGKFSPKDSERLIKKVFETKEVKKLKREMEEYATEAIDLLCILQGKAFRQQLNLLVSSMLEDL